VSDDAQLPLGVVAIGASAGGLQAYTELLEALPATTGMAFVIVQHLAAGHESFLATLLGRITSMPVLEVQDGPRMQANTIYVIPPNRTMVIDDGHLKLREREAGLHFSVDIFFKALALSHGPRAIGVILSGTGSDGTKGIEAIKINGGTTFAQDQSAQQSGMPTSAINTGCVDFVMSPRNIGVAIAKLASVPDLAFGGDPVEPAERVDAILQLVRERVRIDFSQYKENTLHRRIRRRMALSQQENLDDYAALLREKPEEVEALAQDILICVTGFFRDPDSFEALKSSVLPRLLARDSSEDPIRVWVVGCSTGEEAYSLAIALLEAMDDAQKKYPFSVFGTDVNPHAIERARRAWFPKSIAQDLSEGRLKRFFTEVDGGYCVNKLVRDRCIFAPHNAISDPPFSRMDLVSCRNLLIYFQAGPQRKLLPLLHYALKPGGTLFLGASESINNYRDLFDQEDGRHKIYIKRAVPSRVNEAIARSIPAVPLGQVGSPKTSRPLRDRQNDRHRAAEILALKYFAPPGVLVDEGGEILQFRGDTSPFLTQTDGRASLNLLKIAREGLFVALRTGLQHAATQTTPLRTEDAIVKTDAGLTTVSVVVIPVVFSSSEDRCCWVFFESSRSAADSAGGSKRGSTITVDADTVRQISVLTDALMATREHLESTIQEQESVNEDLQAANEEVQSSNEELQSTNEELETSKEEIQSSNEELTTVNDELRLRNEELDRANNDLLNLFSSIQMAVVMLWPDLRIRRFTPLAEKLFNIRATDVGRSITELHHHIAIEDFPSLLKEAIEHGRDIEKEVHGSDGYWYLLRLRPYRTPEGRVDGAVVLLVDIDTLAQTRESLRRRVAELATADRHRNEFLAVLAHELRNPLAPLRNAVQILRRAPGDTEVSTKARDLIDRQVHHMSRLVSDLLDAARTQNGQIKLQRTPIDLRTCIGHVIDMMRPAFEARRQSLQVALPEEPVWVNGDSIRLEQIFTNLLSNANKFTPDMGEIQLILKAVIAADDRYYAAIQVIDNGEGIDAALVPRLFELFTQADRSLAHSQGGLGIGLSLVRTLVEMHGGQVTIRSEGRGRGSTFEIRIPTTRAPADEVPAQRGVVAAASNGRAHRLLVVDDNKDLRESSCELLAMEGIEVAAASTGREALDIAPVFKPTAILLDLGLPDLSGYDVARRLRGMPQFASTLLIAITGYDTPEAHVLSAAAGFDHHISKPVSFDKLQALLDG
jgi:two-component system CheB/CheR fusion protein